MKVYLPNALVQLKDGTVEHRISYDSCISVREAEKVIEFWQNHEDVLCAWVMQNNGNLISFGYFRDSIGNKINGAMRSSK